MDTMLRILTTVFGYEEFRPHQREIIDAVVKGRDTLAVMPTGAGKSLCYQIPALAMSGMTLVISPLISLMKDQVQVLKENGVAAEYLNSTLHTKEYFERLDQIEKGSVKLLYVAPERLDTPGFIERIARQRISFVAVDEAHCISQWGHDFRPSYRNIGALLEQLPARPKLAAFTATATKKVREDICAQLHLQDPYVKVTGFDRPNLYFSVEREVDKPAYLLAHLSNDTSAIVYCATRKTVDEVYAFLTKNGIRTGRYHAGMQPEERQQMQNAFLQDAMPVMVATVAFGMGIDKPDVRRVIHYQMPGSLENYYQEAGRAGRDGEPADVTLLYAPGDIHTQRFLLMQSSEPDTGKLHYMIDYAQTTQCLRKKLLSYFLEDAPERCGHCGNCDTEFLQEEITLDAQKIISCVHRCGERFGGGMIADVLTGSRNKKLLDFGLDKVSTYNVMPDQSKKQVQKRIDQLIGRGYLTRTDDRFPVLRLNEKSMEALAKDAKIVISVRKEDKKTQRIDAGRGLTPAGHEKFERLRSWRSRRAAEENVPAYVIASDRTLLSVLQVLPRTKKELLRVHGIGEAKAERIGEEILAFVREHTDPDERYANAAEAPKPAVQPRPLTERKRTSVRLFREGKSPVQIARELGVAESTVTGHLTDALLAGESIDLGRLLPKERIDTIRAAIEKTDTDYLRPIRDELPEDYTYTEIGLVRAAVLLEHSR